MRKRIMTTKRMWWYLQVFALVLWVPATIMLYKQLGVVGLIGLVFALWANNISQKPCPKE